MKRILAAHVALARVKFLRLRVKLSAELERAKARFAICRGNATRSTSIELQSLLGVPINLGEWSHRVREAYEGQWAKNPARSVRWDWVEINRRYRDPDGLNLAVWSTERLAALLVATTTSEAIIINFFEGDPRSECPLKGKRILIALDVATRYAQARGRGELRIEPLNSALENLYRDAYGFEPVRPRRATPYYARKV